MIDTTYEHHDDEHGTNRGDSAAWVVRSLVKRGDGDALTIVGARPDAEVRLHGLAVDPDRVPMGEVTESLAAAVEQLHTSGRVWSASLEDRLEPSEILVVGSPHRGHDQRSEHP